MKISEEDKELLLKDLCARLPYMVNVKTTGDNESYILLSINSNKNIALIGLDFDDVYATSKIKIDDVKPYLRPISSMTKEEEKEYNELYYDAPQFKDGWRDAKYLEGLHIDYLNKNMFDYRGLIEKGLAIVAPEGIYKVGD